MSSKREAKKDFLYQMYFTAMVFIMIGTLIVSWAKDEGIPFALFQIDSEIASGTVMEYSGTGHNHKLSFRFTDQNGNEYSKSKLINYSLGFNPRSGDAIEVTVFPLYPEVFMATVLVPALEPGFWIMLIGVVFVIFAAVTSLVATLQLLKHNKEERFY